MNNVRRKFHKKKKYKTQVQVKVMYVWSPVVIFESAVCEYKLNEAELYMLG